MSKDVIAILSMQHVNNYGSFLQAYSLRNMLSSLGCDVRFMDIEPREEDDALMKNNRIDFNSEMDHKSSVSKVLDGYLFNRFKNKAVRKKQDQLFRECRDRNFSKIEADDHIKLCVIGSDEVFNCMQESFWGFTSQLFGNINNADRIITYAACCGFTKLKDVPAPVVDKIRESFNNVSFFSVRDTNTYNFVHGITGRDDIGYNLDPALLGNFDREIESAQPVEKLPEKYCLIYSYPNRIHSDDDIRVIKDFCKARGLKIVTIGIPMMWINNYYVADPFQLLKAFKNASFVITDTFHGTIFASKYSERFAVIIRNSNQNKLVDLVNRLDINDHMISDVSGINDVISIRHDKQKMNLMLQSEYNKTMKYLKDNLND